MSDISRVNYQTVYISCRDIEYL